MRKFLLIALLVAGCGGSAATFPAATPTPTASPTPTVQPSPTADTELPAAATHLVRTIDTLQGLVTGLGDNASTSAILSTMGEIERTANDAADWIEQQPVRVQDQVSMAKAHDHLRQVALHVQGALDSLTGGATDDAKQVGAEIAALVILQVSLKQLMP